MKVAFFMYENMAGLAIIGNKEDIFFIPEDAVVPLVKLGYVVDLGTVEGYPLTGEIRGGELVLYLNGQKHRIFPIDKESEVRLRVFADLVDDKRFLNYVVGSSS